MEKAYRVKKNKEFQAIFQKGKSFANRQLVIYYIEKKNQPHFRIGFSVGTKIGNAVMRNRIKRCLRQALFELKEDIQPNYDIVVIARNPAREMDCHSFKKSLIHLLRREKLLRK